MKDISHLYHKQPTIYTWLETHRRYSKDFIGNSSLGNLSCYICKFDDYSSKASAKLLRIGLRRSHLRT